MSLADRMTAAQALFLDTERFAETLALAPSGIWANAVEFAGVWDAGDEEGRNQEEGDGVILEKRGGRRTRHIVVVECSVSVGIDETHDPPDMIRRGTEIVQVKRIIGRDADMMSVECVRVTQIRSRRPDRRG